MTSFVQQKCKNILWSDILGDRSYTHHILEEIGTKVDFFHS